jgi:hypothetical protein
MSLDRYNLQVFTGFLTADGVVIKPGDEVWHPYSCRSLLVEENGTLRTKNGTPSKFLISECYADSHAALLAAEAP